MSNLRHSPDDGVLVRSYAVTHPRDLHLPERAFDAFNQLAYAARGVLDVTTEAGTWIVPSHRALWIPAGLRHRIQMSGSVAVRTLYFRRGLGRSRTPRSCQAVNVPPLLRELILHTTRVGILRRREPKHVRLAQLILDQLEALGSAPLQLPWPTDPRARRAADLLLHSAGEETALTDAARIAGASKRTLERLFISETAMTLGRWRQRARLLTALRLLAQGNDVTRVALDVGYSSPSAFITAFRTQLGTTPSRYFTSPT